MSTTAMSRKLSADGTASSDGADAKSESKKLESNSDPSSQIGMMMFEYITRSESDSERALSDSLSNLKKLLKDHGQNFRLHQDITPVKTMIDNRVFGGVNSLKLEYVGRDALLTYVKHFFALALDVSPTIRNQREDQLKIAINECVPFETVIDIADAKSVEAAADNNTEPSSTIHITPLIWGCFVEQDEKKAVEAFKELKKLLRKHGQEYIEPSYETHTLGHAHGVSPTSGREALLRVVSRGQDCITKATVDQLDRRAELLESIIKAHVRVRASGQDLNTSKRFG